MIRWYDNILSLCCEQNTRDERAGYQSLVLGNVRTAEVKGKELRKNKPEDFHLSGC